MEFRLRMEFGLQAESPSSKKFRLKAELHAGNSMLGLFPECWIETHVVKDEGVDVRGAFELFGGVASAVT